MPQPHAHSALLNASDAFPDLERLRDDFDIVYFLDLCVGVEAAILYDELHVTAFGPGAGAILEPLRDKGVLVDARMQSDDPVRDAGEVMRRSRAAELMARVTKANFVEHADQDLAITAQVAAMSLPVDLAIEEDTGLELVLPFRQTPIYLTIPSVERDRDAVYQAKLNLVARVQELRDNLLAFRQSLAIRDLDRLPLPPLAFETLSRAGTFDELGAIIIEQRDRYSGLRKTFSKARENWSAQDRSLQERYETMAAIDRDMARLAGKVRYVPSVLEPIGDAEKFGEAAMPVALTGDLSKTPKALGVIAKYIEEAAFRFRMRPLLGLVELTQRSSLMDIAAATKALFRHQLTDRDVARALGYAAAADKYVPKNAKAPTAAADED